MENGILSINIYLVEYLQASCGEQVKVKKSGNAMVSLPKKKCYPMLHSLEVWHWHQLDKLDLQQVNFSVIVDSYQFIAPPQHSMVWSGSILNHTLLNLDDLLLLITVCDSFTFFSVKITSSQNNSCITFAPVFWLNNGNLLVLYTPVPFGAMKSFCVSAL